MLTFTHTHTCNSHTTHIIYPLRCTHTHSHTHTLTHTHSYTTCTICVIHLLICTHTYSYTHMQHTHPHAYCTLYAPAQMHSHTLIHHTYRMRHTPAQIHSYAHTHTLHTTHTICGSRWGLITSVSRNNGVSARCPRWSGAHPREAPECGKPGCGAIVQLSPARP